ncbi:MAG: translation initiation factor IF-3 [Patescibacteria group bacterium]|nr:translation initiation factor IF-3 [Patescibacteria group bacterium]MDD5121703.1 translation initiation factor IF-3 [Patescibacteria group bacterium]MDD5221698.1 translation initiation factor IF-3 [Patescibacteria group bacterium]MDD5396133.1 translation initiation factor IF-3 [Patescibacteria group bacterium]
MKYYRINNRIRAPQVRLIDEEGNFLNVVSIEEALEKAKEKGLDLVEINPTQNPPIAKIMDFGQFRYEETKKDKVKKTKKAEIKCIRLSPRTGKHDLEVKAKQAKKFFEEGDKIRIEMFLRGRERMHQNIGEKNINELIALLGEDIIIEQPIARLGNKLNIIIARK